MNCDGSIEIEPVIVVHGGAGDTAQTREFGKIRGVKIAAVKGYEILDETDNAMDAVEKAVRYMECDEYFNAGYGSVLTSNGTVEMDASVMDGRTMKFGCVATLQDILHPISVAREMYRHGTEKFLCSSGAMKFAKDTGFRILDPPGQLVTDYSSSFMDSFINTKVIKMSGRRKKSKNDKNKSSSSNEPKGEVGTVGAVAIDSRGNIAVATSTGGLSGKMPGRIGDTPIIGAGTFADNKIAGVSATGHGETIARACLAHDVVKRMEYLGEDVQTASENACKNMTKFFKGTGGVISIDKNGHIGIAFTSNKMAWAYQRNEYLHYGMRPVLALTDYSTAGTCTLVKSGTGIVPFVCGNSLESTSFLKISM